MQITSSVTDNHDIKVDFYEGPLMASIIVSLGDEEQVMAMLRNSFRDAKALKAGYTRDEVDEMNRERASAQPAD